MRGTILRSLMHVTKRFGFCVSQKTNMTFLSRRRAAPIILLALFCICGVLILGAFPALAADDCKGAGGFVPLECFQGSTKLTDAYNTETLAPFLNKVFAAAISLGAILAVLRLAWAGFAYMSSDLWSTKEHSKEIIQDTLLGLFLLLAIYLILKQINPQILELNVTVDTPTNAPAYNPTGQEASQNAI